MQYITPEESVRERLIKQVLNRKKISGQRRLDVLQDSRKSLVLNQTGASIAESSSKGQGPSRRGVQESSAASSGHVATSRGGSATDELPQPQISGSHTSANRGRESSGSAGTQRRSGTGIQSPARHSPQGGAGPSSGLTRSTDPVAASPGSQSQPNPAASSTEGKKQKDSSSASQKGQSSAGKGGRKKH